MKKWTTWYFVVCLMGLAVCPAAFGGEVTLENILQPVVTGIEHATEGPGETLKIYMTGNIPDVSSFTLTGPDRIVVDLPGGKISDSAIAPAPGPGAVKAIRVGRHPNKVRVVVDVAALSDIYFQTRKEGNAFIVYISTKTKDMPQVAIAASTLSATPAVETAVPHDPAKPDAGQPGGGTAIQQAIVSNNAYFSSDVADIESSEEVMAGNEDIWEENTDAFPEDDEGDLWGEAPPSADEGLRASDLWDEEPTDRGETPEADDLWGDGEMNVGNDSGPSRVEIGGRFRARVAVDTKNEDEFEDDSYGHTELILETKWKPSNRLQMVLSLDIDYFGYINSSDWENDATIRFHDTYINYSHPRFNLKLGNQVVRWGKTDGYSPLDNLNSEDYRDGIAGRREDRKLPIPMANLEIYKGKATIQGIFIPFFLSPELDLTGTDWAIFRHADTIFPTFNATEENPSKSLENSEYGIRIAGIFRNIDYAVSWLHAWEDLPSPDSMRMPSGIMLPSDEFSPLDLAAFATATDQNITLVHDRQNVFGFEIETTVRQFGVRADIAYFDKNSFQTEQLQRILKGSWHYVVGLDYNSPNAWYVNFQFSQHLIHNYEERIVSGVEKASALMFTFQKAFSNGRYEFECRAYYDFSGESTLINPVFLFASWGPFRLEFGGEFFDGSVETPIGFYSDNDQVYGIVEVNF